MISLSVLKSAKAYLCWDVFHNDIAVQLVPVSDAAAYYFPPEKKLQRIVVFYQPAHKDHSKALFYLFHETGHLLQWTAFDMMDNQKRFWELLNLDKGNEKIFFESEAWTRGREFLERFIQSQKLQISLLQDYDRFAGACLSSYSDKD